MALRYRKSIKLGKGLKVNLTKTGVGMTVGGKGMHYSVHSSGRRTTSVGLPGTGLYYQKTTKGGTQHAAAHPSNFSQPAAPIAPVQAGRAVASTTSALNVTSDNYVAMREQFNTLFQQRQELDAAIKVARSKRASLIFAASVKFMSKKAKERRDEQVAVVADLEKQLANKVLHLTFGTPQLTGTWPTCVATFQKLMTSQRIWDVTYTQAIDRVQARSYASNSVNRTLLKSSAAPLDFISSDVECLTLPNANGPDIYVFPTFFLFYKSYQEFGIFDLKKVKFTMALTQFVEREGVPSDTEVVRNTWFKTNKDGSRDKRFNGNYQIPVVKYGDLVIESIGEDGLQEYYMFSGSQAFMEFAKSYVAHAQVLAKLKSAANKT